jgi:septal ring factor EnvC (AmiA/AmiB activator)
MTSEKIKDHYSDDVRLALLEQSINNINNTMIRFEKTFERIERKFEKIDERFDRIDDELKGIRRELKNDTRWLLTVIAALGGIMAHGFHWF